VAAADLLERLTGEAGLIVLPEEPLAHHVPLRVGGPVELWVEAENEDALMRLVSHARHAGGRWRIHSPFSDWLVRDGGLKGTVIRLGQHFESIHLTEDSISLGAAALWSGLPDGLAGGLWDAVRRWSGSVGSLFEQGSAGELTGLATHIDVLRGGRIIQMQWPEDGPPPALGESSILLRVHLRRALGARHWRDGPSRPGALFADPPDSKIGKELQRAGVLGTRLRRWRLSPTEPGTVVHLGGGSFKDLQMLVKGLRMRVEKTRGLTLETRIPVLGNEPGRRNR
jgi:UDP-N-acetylmuramate dehydrogenase